jgi:hypothetical protein
MSSDLRKRQDGPKTFKSCRSSIDSTISAEISDEHGQLWDERTFDLLASESSDPFKVRNDCHTGETTAPDRPGTGASETHGVRRAADLDIVA